MSDDLFKSAVDFLKDESLKDKPLDQKKLFLKKKGLNDEQIEKALLESESHVYQETIPQTSRTSSQYEQPRYEYYAVPPPLPRRDWKDYLIMATSTAGVLYGCYSLTKNYIIPRILPKEQSQLDADKLEIDSRFDKLDQVLERLEEQEKELKLKEEEKIAKLEETLKELTATLAETESSKNKMDNEFRLMKAELLNLQNTVDRFVLNSTKSHELENINREIKSLKLLMSKPKDQTSPNAHNINQSSPNKNNSPMSIPHEDNKNVGIAAVPSASDILSKMNLTPKATTPLLNTSADVPAWLQGNSTDSKLNKKIEIPEWQKQLTSGNEDTEQ